MKKRFISLLTAFIIIFAFSITAYAESDQDNAVVPTRYSYTMAIQNSLSISNHNATCFSKVEGRPSLVTKIELSHHLEEDIGGGWWYRIGSWSDTFYTYRATMQNSKSGIPSGTYHVRTTAKVYAGSNYETITIYSVTKTC